MDLSHTFLFERIGISLLLGMLVGLQREHMESPLAGLRTFPLITVLGTLSAVIDRQVDASGWVIAASLLGVVAVVIVTHIGRVRAGLPRIGMTTMAAVLVMFCVGCYLADGVRSVGIAVGAGVAVLLQFKPELHGLAARLGDEDMRAVMQFVLLTCVVLPVLPDQQYGPFGVWNPFHIWLMVVLIVGISLAGYISYKFFGRNAGILLSGVLGGAISSTATTVSYSRRSSSGPQADRIAAVIIMIASSIVFVRVLVEIAVVAPNYLRELGPPLLVMLGAGLASSLVMWVRLGNRSDEMPTQANPTELGSALFFGGLYALVLLALAAAEHYLGGRGMYAVAVASGLTDMDAITLSTAQLVDDGVGQGGIPADTGWRLLVVASMSNLVFKCGIVALLGRRRLLQHTALLFAAPMTAGAILLWYF